VRDGLYESSGGKVVVDDLGVRVRSPEGGAAACVIIAERERVEVGELAGFDRPLEGLKPDVDAVLVGN
jgi:hypothetical protein